VTTQGTDENSNTIKTTYSAGDFWRPAAIYDQAQNETTIGYAGQTQAQSVLINSSTSQTVYRTTLDGLGRLNYSQRWQGPGSSGNYDTAETDYNIMGQASRTTMLYSAPASPSSPNLTTPASNATYDALGRVLTMTDANGGSTTYTYTNNDVLQTVSGTQTFKKQFEYDGLGRLTSVCEIVSSSLQGKGPCNQGVPQTGYLTNYSYDALGRLLGVTQNSQTNGTPQTRAFAYDMLGRMTSETNPESGTKNYYYDSDTTMCGNGPSTSNGDLVKTTDAAGNCVMYYSDALHRISDVGNNNQALNHCRRFRYDNSTGYAGSTKPAGLVNTLGRLIEATIDLCAGTNDTLLSDEWFSYSLRGELTDVYQSTLHSGGYYHSKASYWANGALNTLSLLNSSGASIIPTQTYSLDGEGRPISVTAASGQSPVTSVSYAPSPTSTAPLGAITNVTFGSQDSDSYQYDPTGKMTQYSFNVNGQSAIGKLTWNTNGTFQKLVVTDPFNSLDNNQTCNYGYDDLARVNSANCGSSWAQTFSYDPFGNVSKSGSSSWLPIYNSPANDNVTANNQYKSGWNGVSYDQTGNLLNDTFNTYTWDVYGSLLSVNGTSIIYDAFGRMVENKNGSYQYVYSPIGGQPLAVMSGQTTAFVYLPLPGGAFAMYNGAGLFQYNHPDWLGSARLFSSTSRVATPAMSYAPFGEGYAAGSSNWAQFTSAGNAWTIENGSNGSGSLDDFMYRRYSPSQGHWISPDPAGTAAVDPMNPQSWNRYAYVLNNPLTLVDPLGLIWDGGAWCVAPESTDGLGGGGGGGPASGIFEGELSLSLPTQPLDPNSPQAQAIIALLTGNWRGLLDSALGAASQDLWNMVPDPAIMDAENPANNGQQNTIGPPQQWIPAKSSWLSKYLTQLGCESSVIIAKASDQFEVLFGGTLGVTLGVARSSPFVTGGGALLLSAAILGDAVTARSQCVPIAWGN
jgi:RHS repeat-associated protein